MICTRHPGAEEQTSGSVPTTEVIKGKPSKKSGKSFDVHLLKQEVERREFMNTITSHI